MFNEYGIPKFSSVHDVLRHIRLKGVSSEWHRQVFLSLPWNDWHHATAHKEGWAIRRDGELINRDKVLKGVELNDPLCLRALTEATRRKLTWQQ